VETVSIDSASAPARTPRISGAQRRQDLRRPLHVTPPPRPKAPPVRLRPQTVRGTWGSDLYVKLRAAQRSHTKILFEGHGWAFVQSIVRTGDQFSAVIQPVRERKVRDGQ